MLFASLAGIYRRQDSSDIRQGDCCICFFRRFGG